VASVQPLKERPSESPASWLDRHGEFLLPAQTPRVYGRRMNGSEPKRSGPELGAVALFASTIQSSAIWPLLAGKERRRVVKRLPLMLRIHLDPRHHPLLVDSDDMSAGCGRLPVVEVEDAPQLARSAALLTDVAAEQLTPARSPRCRRRSPRRRGSPSPRCRASWARTPPAPLQARTGASGSSSWPTPTPGDELARPRVPRRALRLRSRACAGRAALDRRVRADVAAPRRSARRAAVPRRRLTRWWWRRASPKAEACGAAFVRFAGPLNDRGAEFANAVACARDRPLAR
jgi:hypothetical protein